MTAGYVINKEVKVYTWAFRTSSTNSIFEVEYET